MKRNLLLWLISLFLIGCQIDEEWQYPSSFWGFAVEGYPITEQDLELLQKETKIDPEMIVFYLQWPIPVHQHEPITPTLEAIWNGGAIPCLTWEPMSVIDQIETTIPYEDILDGLYDPYLFAIADDIKSWEKPLVIRFAHEMNLSRYHWGTQLADYGPESPEIYKKMFRYVVDAFKSKQVINVFWAFCPNVDSIPNDAWNVPRNYYPGDQYVDLLGMDGYNWDISSELATSRKLLWTSPWRSFEQIFKPLYLQLKKIAPRKPIVVFETASVQRSGGQRKVQWIQDALEVSKKWGIKGIVWFQANKEEDWRIEQFEDNSLSSQPSFQMWLQNHISNLKK